MRQTHLLLGWATAIIIVFFTTLGAALPAPAKQDPDLTLSGTNDTNTKTNSTMFDFAHVTCETSWSSPTYPEISGLMDILKTKKGKCKQKNVIGSKCTTIASFLGANAGLCGKPLWTVDCADLVTAISIIRQDCGNDDMQRAGGTWLFGVLKAVLF
ncbi:hypothetical protein FN846DRAFT_935947 [Sphaerosporella brunnea]|uniref:Uncharacterized protein n=1 Tax=Sphaerosporella brunnea TaxID=1250544 RepID=A0A5J5F4W6_9PEZI|nr:hypothetical protein FN846DRAFT_935947 [Sphaerosporella brunnea]